MVWGGNHGRFFCWSPPGPVFDCNVTLGVSPGLSTKDSALSPASAPSAGGGQGFLPASKGRSGPGAGLRRRASDLRGSMKPHMWKVAARLG